MRLFLLGKAQSVTHWVEDAAGAFRALGHQVEVGFVRRPWIAQALERRLAESLAARLAHRVARADAAMVLSVGGFHAPQAAIENVAAAPSRPPLVAWVGDLFDESARPLADLHDLVAYTDTALLARHKALGFRSPALYLPHAVDPALQPQAREPRVQRMLFIANPTPGRRLTVGSIEDPIAVVGPGWRREDGPWHDINARRISARSARILYAGSLAALNVRNEINVLAGLNQRNFEPCLVGAALVTDAQGDLELCFDPGREVLVWRDFASLNEAYRSLLREPLEAARLGLRGRARVLADHTYARRLETLMAVL